MTVVVNTVVTHRGSSAPGANALFYFVHVLAARRDEIASVVVLETRCIKVNRGIVIAFDIGFFKPTTTLWLVLSTVWIEIDVCEGSLAANSTHANEQAVVTSICMDGVNVLGISYVHMVNGSFEEG